MESLEKLTGFKHLVTSAYHPQSNGLDERLNQTLKAALQKLVNESQDDWDQLINNVLFAYPSQVIHMYGRTYISLHCSEVNDLCNCLYHTRNVMGSSTGIFSFELPIDARLMVYALSVIFFTVAAHSPVSAMPSTSSTYSSNQTLVVAPGNESPALEMVIDCYNLQI